MKELLKSGVSPNTVCLFDDIMSPLDKYAESMSEKDAAAKLLLKYNKKHKNK
jgi:hypothetical protein